MCRHVPSWEELWGQQQSKKTKKTTIHASLFSWLKGIVSITVQQEEDQEDKDVHVVIFLAKKSYEDNNWTKKNLGAHLLTLLSI